MADNNYVGNDVTTNPSTLHGNEEPATGHDVAEGGGIGAVGGAIVGGIAGGPIGAVIGAVAGGLASAGAVDVVDKHDGDYNRTVGTAGTASGYTGDTNYDPTIAAVPVTGGMANVGATSNTFDNAAYVPVRDEDVTAADADSATSADPRYRNTTTNY